MRWSCSMMTRGCHSRRWRWRWMNERTTLMVRRLLAVSWCRLAVMMGCMMRCLIRCHKRRLSGRCVRRIGISMNSSITSRASGSWRMGWIVMRSLTSHLRQRMQHMMRKILRHSLYGFLIHSCNRSGGC